MFDKAVREGPHEKVTFELKSEGKESSTEDWRSGGTQSLVSTTARTKVLIEILTCLFKKKSPRPVAGTWAGKVVKRGIYETRLESRPDLENTLPAPA